MTDLRTAAQQALEALTDFFNAYPHMAKGYTEDAITALRAALAEPVRECPNCASLEAQNTELDRKLAELERKLGERATGSMWEDTLMRCIDHHAAELFRLRAKVQQLEALPQRKPLTDDEIDRITDQEWAANNHKPIYAAHRAFARAIERARGIGEKE